MLALRPSCEHCDKPLPPDSLEARICSYECTFCADCVEQVLLGVCPNCGGGLCPRPVRPVRAWREGLSLASRPAQTHKAHRPVDPVQHAAFAEAIRYIPPHER